MDIRLSLSVDGNKTPIVLNVPSDKQVIRCMGNGYGESIYFEVLLTKDQVVAIEEYRKSGDLALSFALRAMTISGDDVCSSFDVSGHSVAREEWLKALRSSRFQDALLLEIPIPEVTEEIRQLVSKAQEFIEHGHYNDAVTQCRKVIEALEVIRGDRADAKNAARKLVGNGERHSMTVIERMLAMREQVKNICQLGVHGDEPFTRSQARAVLSAMLSLLADPTVGFISSELIGLAKENSVSG